MVRLLTVIGHGTDLIEHHIQHYLGYVDEIQYVVYETDFIFDSSFSFFKSSICF